MAGILCGLCCVAGSALSAQPTQGDAIVQCAERYIDVREATGHNDGVVVEAMLGDVGMPRGANWCGAFVHRAITDAGVLLPGHAKSFAWVPTWTSRNIVWTAERELTRRTRAGNDPHWRGASASDPLPGDVFTIWFSALGRAAHTGIIKQWGPIVITIEGNTSAVAYSRNGDGVYCKRRQQKQLYRVSRWN